MRQETRPEAIGPGRPPVAPVTSTVASEGIGGISREGADELAHGVGAADGKLVAVKGRKEVRPTPGDQCAHRGIGPPARVDPLCRASAAEAKLVERIERQSTPALAGQTRHGLVIMHQAAVGRHSEVVFRRTAEALVGRGEQCELRRL